MKTKRWLVIPDCHHPFSDMRAWKLLLKVAKKFDFHGCLVLGDFADLYAVSSHDKSDPSIRLEWEVAETKKRRAELDAIGFKEKLYTTGNHEERIRRYITKNAPELSYLVNEDKLLGLSENGWKVTPYRKHTRVGKLYATHDSGGAGKYEFVRVGASFEASVVIGHVHRMGVHYWNNLRGDSHVSAAFGWLGDKEKADYMHKVRRDKDWTLGFGTLVVEPNGVVHLQAVPIIHYKACVFGEVVGL